MSAMESVKIWLHVIGDYKANGYTKLVEVLESKIGMCSEQFERKLTDTDMKDNRLYLSSEIVKKGVLPSLRQGITEEDIEKGIMVKVYDCEGETYEMELKRYKTRYVLQQEWVKFKADHPSIESGDGVKVWIFPDLQTQQLCFVITTFKPNAN